ncbi:MAG: rhodanese-like domain-containing protein [Candidatus Saccharibacteria bacterium]
MNIVEDVTDGKAQLLDVRTKDEWKASHAVGAMHISVNNLLTGYVGELDPDLPIYIYCATGARAGTAASYLHRQGYDSTNIGGLSTWQGLGGAITR